MIERGGKLVYEMSHVTRPHFTGADLYFAPFTAEAGSWLLGCGRRDNETDACGS